MENMKKNMMDNTKFDIKKSREYHRFMFGLTDTYSGFDVETQERLKRSYEWFDEFEDGVYKERI